MIGKVFIPLDVAAPPTIIIAGGILAFVIIAVIVLAMMGLAIFLIIKSVRKNASDAHTQQDMNQPCKEKTVHKPHSNIKDE